MDAVCEVCGETFQAKRRTARFCSSNCRVRAHAQVVPLKKPGSAKNKTTKAKTGETDVEVAQLLAGNVEAAAIKQLQEAGRLDSVLGQAALVLARRLDRVTVDTGSAVAGVVKQLEATLEAATAGANVAEDPVDELRRRRDQKLGIVG